MNLIKDSKSNEPTPCPVVQVMPSVQIRSIKVVSASGMGLSITQNGQAKLVDVGETVHFASPTPYSIGSKEREAATCTCGKINCLECLFQFPQANPNITRDEHVQPQTPKTD